MQIEELMDQDAETKESLGYLAEKLKRLILLHEKCAQEEKKMRAKQLALMRERNLYLEKCRKIEYLGEDMGWEDEQGLLPFVHQILYQVEDEEST